MLMVFSACRKYNIASCTLTMWQSVILRCFASREPPAHKEKADSSVAMLPRNDKGNIGKLSRFIQCGHSMHGVADFVFTGQKRNTDSGAFLEIPGMPTVSSFEAVSYSVTGVIAKAGIASPEGKLSSDSETDEEYGRLST